MFRFPGTPNQLERGPSVNSFCRYHALAYWVVLLPACLTIITYLKDPKLRRPPLFTITQLSKNPGLTEFDTRSLTEVVTGAEHSSRATALAAPNLAKTLAIFEHHAVYLRWHAACNGTC